MKVAIDALLARIVDEADAGQLPVLIEEWLATGDARQWLARALRLDLPILVEHPALVVPCLLRRCAWFGEEFPPFAKRAAPPPDAAAVRGLARSWELAWAQPYLRSLRTPQVPLDGGVLEEYRSGAEGEPWLTATHVGLGDAVAWERASGRRVAVAAAHAVAAPPPPARAWTLAHQAAKLVSADRAWPLPIAPGDRATALFELDAELALLEARYDEDPYGEDYDYRTYAIELRTGQVRFVLDQGCTAAARFGDRIYSVDDGRFHVTTLAGDDVVRGRVIGAGLTFGPDGTFATRAGHVLRIHDPARVGELAIASIYRKGLFALSPDSTRALTGQILCDAHTGEALAQIELSGLGPWLEGGPPRDCRALCDDVVVELLPFGYHLWDSTTGEVLVDDRDHHASHDDAVAFAPNGRTHAVWRRGTLRVFDNYSLEILHEAPLAPAEPRRLRLDFAADGTALWWREGEGSVAIAIQLAGEAQHAPEPRRPATIGDGLVTLDELRLPIDDVDAQVSHDGAVVLGTTAHYVRG